MTTYRRVRPNDPSPGSEVGGTPGRMGHVTKSQMNVSLPLALHERLREIAWGERRSLSSVVCGLLDAGLEGRGRGAAGEAEEARRRVRG